LTDLVTFQNHHMKPPKHASNLQPKGKWEAIPINTVLISI